jgi:hypothetical protein
MVELDPAFLLMAAGSIAVGLGAAAVCLRKPSKSSEATVLSNTKFEQSAAVKPKKKQSKSKKTTSSTEPTLSAAETAESEIAAILASVEGEKTVKKNKAVVKVVQSASVIAALKAAAKIAEDKAEAEARAEEEEENASDLAEAAAEAAAKAEIFEKNRLAKAQRLSKTMLMRGEVEKAAQTSYEAEALNNAYESAKQIAKEMAETNENKKSVMEAEKIFAKNYEAANVSAEMLAEEMEEEMKKNKKPKESAEQKVARLERQKLAKVKKTEEEGLSKSVAIKLAATENVTTPSTYSPTPTPVHIDGWAVVEDKRKVKAKVLPSAPTKSDATDTDDMEASEEPAVPKDFVKAEISVSQKKIGTIIGPKGITLHGIQAATGVEINTPKGDRDSTGLVVVTVTGTADGVARATEAINDLCAKGYSKLLAGEDFKESSMEVHPRYTRHM